MKYKGQVMYEFYFTSDIFLQYCKEAQVVKMIHLLILWVKTWSCHYLRKEMPDIASKYAEIKI